MVPVSQIWSSWLFVGVWDGQPLGGDEYVISADEKTAIGVPAAGVTPPWRRGCPG